MKRGFEVATKNKETGALWGNTKMPVRSTSGAVGYDFFAAEDVCIPSIWSSPDYNSLSSVIDLECLKELILTQEGSRKTRDKIAFSMNNGEFPKEFLQDEDIVEAIQKLTAPTKVHTGIKAYFPKEEGLFLFNRSGNPKLGLVLANSVGVVDSDYYSCKLNDGEIMFSFYNFSMLDYHVKAGDKIGQGLFLPVLFADDDNCENVEREGGHGSTGK